jgi:hypothetical protein
MGISSRHEQGRVAVGEDFSNRRQVGRDDGASERQILEEFQR